MNIEIYIFWQIAFLVLFGVAFYTKQEILWALSLLSGALVMFSSYNIQHHVYQYNATISAYYPTVISSSHPYLMGINMAFFIIGLLLALFDIFDKYSEGISIFKK